ncbi:MAG: ParA family protein [Verrucomicrobiae bacterium]|nr:ParA family protein [Verrucomicrobiae bacterium]
MRIAFLNQKGGVGKTTLVLLLSSVLKRAGYDVAIDDRDPQGTSSVFAAVFGVPLLSENADAEYVVTDTPGHLRIEGEVERELSALIKQSDKLILVTEKSLASIHGSAPMAKLINKKKSPQAKAYVLFNQVRVQTMIGKQKGEDLAAKLGLPALTNELPLSAAFENAFSEGLSAVTGQHRDELLNLALEIMK